MIGEIKHIATKRPREVEINRNKSLQEQIEITEELGNVLENEDGFYTYCYSNEIAYVVEEWEASDLELYIGSKKDIQNKSPNCLMKFLDIDGKRYFHQTYAQRGNTIRKAGTSYIGVYQGEYYKEEHTLIIYSKEIDEEDYREMLLDLISIQVDLITLGEKDNSVSVGNKRKNLYEEIGKQIKKLEVALRKINQQPEEILQQYWDNIPIEKVKHMTAKSIIEKKMLKKNKVKAVQYTTSNNLYEHRILKQYLNKLELLLKQCEESDKREIEFAKKEVLSSMGGRKFAEDEKNKKSELDDDINAIKEEIKIQLDESSPIVRCNPGNPLVVQLIITDIPICTYDENTKIEPWWDEKIAKPFRGTLYKRERCFYRVNNEEVVFESYHIKMIKLSSENIKFHYFLQNTLAKITANNIEKYIKIEGEWDGNVIKGDGEKFPTYSLGFTEIHKIIIGNVSYDFWQFNESVDWTDEDMVNRIYDIFYKVSEELSRLNALYKKNKYIDKLQENTEEDKQQKQLIEASLQGIERMRHLPFVANVSTREEHLYCSTIFKYHTEYRYAYKILREIERKYSAIDFKEVDEYPVKSLPSLYENWCFIKIIKIFLDEYQFQLESITKKDLATIIGGYLNQKDPSDLVKLRTGVEEILRQHKGLSGSKIKLSRKMPNGFNLCVQISFDQVVQYRDGNHRRPDFILEIQYGNKTSIFCMDAKFRDYKKMIHGATSFEGDIREVAYGKYVKELENKANGEIYRDIKGSYILHSSKNCHNKKQKYYGTNKKKLEEILGDEVENVKPHQVGSVGFYPSETFNFKNLIRMMMEYHLEIWNQKCWICGNEEGIDVSEYKTVRGYDKYYITCHKCNEFWVKTHCSKAKMHEESKVLLVKHLTNYHEEIEGDYWKVNCPECDLKRNEG